MTCVVFIMGISIIDGNSSTGAIHHMLEYTFLYVVKPSVIPWGLFY